MDEEEVRKGMVGGSVSSIFDLVVGGNYEGRQNGDIN